MASSAKSNRNKDSKKVTVTKNFYKIAMARSAEIKTQVRDSKSSTAKKS